MLIPVCENLSQFEYLNSNKGVKIHSELGHFDPPSKQIVMKILELVKFDVSIYTIIYDDLIKYQSSLVLARVATMDIQ